MKSPIAFGTVQCNFTALLPSPESRNEHNGGDILDDPSPDVLEAALVKAYVLLLLIPQAAGGQHRR
jgi:hypothetical protein